jgi:tRNA(Ile)-lysidine synthase
MSKNSSPPPKRRSRGNEDDESFLAALQVGARELIGETDRVVLAVSGGADSMAMLHGWLECGLPTPVVAHFDHRLRPESGADAEFVSATATRLGVQCEIGVWDAPSPGEKAARDARYRFLIEVARKNACSAIATAHTRDDQAETILFRILRGTGVDGLAGMKKSRLLSEDISLIRPMLAIRRSLARRFLVQRGIEWREDASNDDRRRSRNRIRHELLPRLAKEFNPRVVEALSRVGESAGDVQTIVENRIEELYRSIPVVASSEEAVVPLSSLQDVSAIEARLFLRMLVSRQRWPVGRISAEHWSALADVASKDGPPRWQGPEGMTAERTATSFVVRRRTK